MAVTTDAKRKEPYLAVGMADGSLSIWTYEAALRQAASKKNEPFRRLLYPLCRLDALWVLNSVAPTTFTDEKRQNADGKFCAFIISIDAAVSPSSCWGPGSPGSP